jgi:hypothetical protein
MPIADGKRYARGVTSAARTQGGGAGVRSSEGPEAQNDQIEPKAKRTWLRSRSALAKQAPYGTSFRSVCEKSLPLKSSGSSTVLQSA